MQPTREVHSRFFNNFIEQLISFKSINSYFNPISRHKSATKHFCKYSSRMLNELKRPFLIKKTSNHPIWKGMQNCVMYFQFEVLSLEYGIVRKFMRKMFLWTTNWGWFLMLFENSLVHWKWNHLKNHPQTNHKGEEVFFRRRVQEETVNFQKVTIGSRGKFFES